MANLLSVIFIRVADYTECHVCILMLIVIVMNIIMLNAVMLNATMLNLIMLTVECLYQLPGSICLNNKMNILNVNFVHCHTFCSIYLSQPSASKLLKLILNEMNTF
jgi:hypothetical protein